MYTLLLDNCIFQYSVLYFPAPCGLEVMAGKCILHIEEKFRIVNRQTRKKQMLVGVPPQTARGAHKEKNGMKHKTLYKCSKTRVSINCYSIYFQHSLDCYSGCKITFWLLNVKKLHQF